MGVVISRESVSLVSGTRVRAHKWLIPLCLWTVVRRTSWNYVCDDINAALLREAQRSRVLSQLLEISIAITAFTVRWHLHRLSPFFLISGEFIITLLLFTCVLSLYRFFVRWVRTIASVFPPCLRMFANDSCGLKHCIWFALNIFIFAQLSQSVNRTTFGRKLPLDSVVSSSLIACLYFAE